MLYVEMNLLAGLWMAEMLFSSPSAISQHLFQAEMRCNVGGQGKCHKTCPHCTGRGGGRK